MLATDALGPLAARTGRATDTLIPGFSGIGYVVGLS
jgi:hypothetical protein